ncbi:hypothetical protein, partial [Pusillimonas noertemannii]|uniref:hypothetical protein n=1 Tax=Pusillimonas noertemannii TaxID=305977 RepID=UPI001A9C6454
QGLVKGPAAHSFQAPTLIGCFVVKEQGSCPNLAALNMSRLAVTALLQRNEIMKQFFWLVKLRVLCGAFWPSTATAS